MRKSTTLLLLFFALITFGQDNTIGTSDLVGYWTFDRIVKKPNYNIMVYKRCNFNENGKIVRFKPDGKYHIYQNWGPRRCGNEGRPKNVSGIFKLDPEAQKVKLNGYSASFGTNWDLIWIDKYSFGVKKPKPDKG